MKAEECEVTSDDALQNSASKVDFLIVSILVSAVFLKVFLCGFSFTLGAERHRCQACQSLLRVLYLWET